MWLGIAPIKSVSLHLFSWNLKPDVAHYVDRAWLKGRARFCSDLRESRWEFSIAVNRAQSSCVSHWYNCSDLSGIDPSLCHCNWDCSVHCLNSVGCAFFQDGNYLQTITASFLTLRLAISEIFGGAGCGKKDIKPTLCLVLPHILWVLQCSIKLLVLN